MMMKKHLKLRSSLVVLAVASVFNSGVAWSRPLGPELQQVVVDHPLIKAGRKSIEASDFLVDAARSGYFPKITISGDRGSEQISTTAYQPVNNRIDASSVRQRPQESDLRREKFLAVIEQNLFSGGRTQALVGIAEFDFAAQENAFQATMQNTLLEALTAYLQVGRYKTLIAIAKRNEETTQRQLKLEDARVQRGGGIAVDVLQAKTRLQIARERVVFQEQGLRDAVAQYRQVFGREPDLEMIQDVDVLRGQLPASLEEAIEASRQMSPVLKESALQRQKAMRQIRVEQAGLMPSIDLVGTSIQDKNANAQADRDERSLLLKMNWNLFAGGETVSRSRAAMANHESLVEREVNVSRKVEESVRVAWHQLVNGKERQDLLENAANIAHEVMQSRKRLRDAGKETAINVLDAEVEYFGVQSNRINAMYETRIGSYRLLAAMGLLSPKLLGLEQGDFLVPVKPLELNFDAQ